MINNFEIHIDFDRLESNSPKFECEFNFEGVKVYTTKKEIVFIGSIGSYETMSFQEVTAKCRPKIIAIFDIISFLIGDSITIYDINHQSCSVKPNEDEVETKSNKFKFIFNDVDLSSQLRIILSKIENDKNTTLTLLDKWNKANYLLSVDDSHVLFLDETIINCFNIFELLADTTKKEYERFIDEQSKKLLFEFYTNVGNLDNNKINDKVNQKNRLIKEILVGEFLNLSDKFKYYLKKYRLLDENLSYFVDRIIKVRNSIAHGRIVSNLSVMEYPLTPFYNIVNPEANLVNPIIVLTGVLISKYIGIDIWEEEWEKIKEILEPNPVRVKEVIEGKLAIDINEKNQYNLTWYSVFLYYLSCKDKQRDNIELWFKEEIKKRKFETLDFYNLYEISVILITTQDYELYQILSKIIFKIIKEDICKWSSYRDIFLHLEVRNIVVEENKKKIDEIINKP
ncbi:hypothetical protein DXB95_05060 [Streptococcus ilei]|uniref:hypothetical protein n=1 Tax=Streptococcus ilei TaxID=1156431 RepID=UPI000E44B988|nr:hypothetical protein [Streptococcus ilei]RGM74516.1 hypothetical protein DXB95_05060 [Streptococcus ilei]